MNASPHRAEHDQVYVHRALSILRDAGADINRIDAETSLREALHLIAATAIRLIDATEGDNVRAVIYTYDAAAGEFDPASRVSAGEGDAPLLGDAPRAGGVGSTAIQRRSRVLSYEEPIVLHPLKYQAGIRTAACYPLLVTGKAVGALYIDLQSERRFTDEELLVLDTFVQSAAVAIYNTRQFEGINRALQRKVDQLEKLQRAEQLISSRLHLDDTLREILATALELIRAEHGSFRLLDKRTGLLKTRAVIADQTLPPLNDEGLEVSERSGVMGWVALHRHAARIGDLREAPWSDIYRPLSQEREMRSELAVPLLGPGGGLEGVLNVESPRALAFTADHQNVLEALATQAIIAIQEAKLIETIEEVTAHMIVHTPDELFALLLERARDLLNVDHAAIWQMDSGTPPSLVARASTGAIPPRYQVPVQDSLLGLAVLTRQPVTTLDFLADPRVTRPDLVHQMSLVSGLIVPLMTSDNLPRGAFGVYTLEPRLFSDWDTRLLASLANHAAIALQQAEALEQLKLARERQAVAETFAVLGDIAANLLHRVNNLIGVIPVRVQGILDKRPALQADVYVEHSLHEIEDSARAAMVAARESMAYLRPLHLQPTSVEQCYRTALTRLTHTPANLELSAAGLDTLPPVLAGDEQLRLVLFNLIENAIDALGDKGGHVKVQGRLVADSLTPDREWVEIAVTDDGPGVPADFREKIFEPDFSTKRSVKKLGFGLWWTRSLIQRFGGTILVNNTAGAETGSTFIIHLPPASAKTETLS